MVSDGYLVKYRRYVFCFEGIKVEERHGESVARVAFVSKIRDG